MHTAHLFTSPGIRSINGSAWDSRAIRAATAEPTWAFSRPAETQ
ncbi:MULTISPECIES: hypothetical protein [unclassified Natrinema]|nr:hypothetical protein NJ7G_1195 [Natrinema sp. J7-2]